MAVLATPGKGDPEVLAQISSLAITAHTTIVTPANASTRGVTVTSLIVCNKTSSGVTFTLEHKNAGGSYFIICNAMTIPGDGVPVEIVGDSDTALISQIFLAAGATVDLLTGAAGTASALDINVYGVQYDT